MRKTAERTSGLLQDWNNFSLNENWMAQTREYLL